mmetsp:Transcript_12332/g.44370  ORF Transcript_12332/g.44370 Transcript_12332/m.44370 type:complete len:331 (-) Transcript_12332:288-1280(-)
MCGRFFVLHLVPLVQDHRPPVDFLRQRQIKRRVTRHLVRRHRDVVRPDVHDDLFPESLPLVLVRGVQPHDAERRAPLLELVHPRRQHGQRANHQVRAFHVSHLVEAREERNRLKRLPEAHLVRENARAPVVVHPRHPPNPLELVLSQHGLDLLRLVVHGREDLFRRRVRFAVRDDFIPNFFLDKRRQRLHVVLQVVRPLLLRELDLAHHLFVMPRVFLVRLRHHFRLARPVRLTRLPLLFLLEDVRRSHASLAALLPRVLVQLLIEHRRLPVLHRVRVRSKHGFAVDHDHARFGFPSRPSPAALLRDERLAKELGRYRRGHLRVDPSSRR